jgi:hypothetical protein
MHLTTEIFRDFSEKKVTQNIITFHGWSD